MTARAHPATLHAGDPLWADRRAWLTTYFDRTAAGAWAKLTSDAPVSGIRRTVREGRDRMRALLASYLPDDLRGAHVLDAGCGPGTFALLLAARGARVTAVDVSPTLVGLARERAAGMPGAKHVSWRVGDMLDPGHGRFDYVVAMDSLIHYPARQIAGALGRLAERTSTAMVGTFAPATRLLSTMHLVGRCLPGRDRAPAIEPVAMDDLRALVLASVALCDWRWARAERVASGFYTSHAFELRHVDAGPPYGAAAAAPAAVLPFPPTPETVA